MLVGTWSGWLLGYLDLFGSVGDLVYKVLFDEVQVVLTQIESQHGHLVALLLDPVRLLHGEKLEIIWKISLTNDFSYQISSSVQLADKVCNK